jgi:hypothetical protein
LIYHRLYKYSNSITLSPCTNFNIIFIRLFYPSSFIYFMLIHYYIIILLFYLFDQYIIYVIYIDKLFINLYIFMIFIFLYNLLNSCYILISCIDIMLIIIIFTFLYSICYFLYRLGIITLCCVFCAKYFYMIMRDILSFIIAIRNYIEIVSTCILWDNCTTYCYMILLLLI